MAKLKDGERIWVCVSVNILKSPKTGNILAFFYNKDITNEKLSGILGFTISSETDEMLRTCSRLVVMRDRKVVGELSGEELTQNMIMSTIAGGESNEK